MSIKKRGRLLRRLILLASIAATVMLGAGSASAATYKEKDYNHVYSYSYFKAHNTDLPSSILKSRKKSLTYFVEHGMAQGRIGKAEFNVKIYKQNYPKYVKQFGNNLKKYYLHYQTRGYLIRYAKRPLSYYKFTLRVKYNGGKHNGHTSDSIRIRRYGTTITLPSCTRSGYSFAGWELISGKGTLKGNTYKYTNDLKRETVIRAKWTKEETVTQAKGAAAMAEFAKTQLGKGGETYWAYFKDVFSSPQEWCCMFATYCAYKAGLISKTASYGTIGNGHYPRTASQRELASVLKARGQLKLKSSGYVPKKGDLIFFTRSSSAEDYTQNYSHVGIVYGTKTVSGKKYVMSIEGNTGTYNKYTSYVKMSEYELAAKYTREGSSKRITAFGIIK